jgi:hypothetical protein
MPGFSNTVEKRLLDALFKSTTFPLPAQIHISLHSADPGDTGANELVVGTSPGYARAARAPDPNNTTHTSWQAVDQTAEAAAIRNAAAVTFPEATADWNGNNKITHWGAWDAGSGGVFLCGGTIAAGGVTVNQGVTLTFDPAELEFTVN